MARVYLGLGSNINPLDNLRIGVHELRECYGELSLSAIYESAALGFDGADFLNMVVGLETDVPPHELQMHAERIHDVTGRDRTSARFASRPLDIDLLLYGDMIADEPNLKLPRIDVLNYNFVLRPLAELDPELIHPVTGMTMQEHWRQFNSTSHPLRPVDVIL